MAVVNGPAPYPKVSVAKPTKIGSIATVTDILQFALSEPSFYHTGSLVIQAVPQPAGGTVTTFTASLALSFDGGVTFNTQIGTTPATVASTTAAINFQTNPLQNIAIPGVGGQISLQFQTATLTLGTATSIAIWVLVA